MFLTKPMNNVIENKNVLSIKKWKCGRENCTNIYIINLTILKALNFLHEKILY